MSGSDVPEPRDHGTPESEPHPDAGPIRRVTTGEMHRAVPDPDPGGAGGPGGAEPGQDDGGGPLHPGTPSATPTLGINIDELEAPEPAGSADAAERPRTAAVLPTGSVELPGSPDDRAKTEPDWDAVDLPDAPPHVPSEPYPGAEIPFAPTVAPEPPATTGLIDPAIARASMVAYPSEEAPRTAQTPVVEPPARPLPAREAGPRTAPIPRVPARPAGPQAPPAQAPGPAAPSTRLPAGRRPPIHLPGARRVISRLWQTESPPTQAFSIVDRLIGSPYANPRVIAETQDVTARRTLEFTVDLAETMFRFGAGALEVETSVIAVTASLGLRHVDVDITNQSIHLNWAPEDQVPISILRVVRSWSGNFGGLALVHQLVSDIVAGALTRGQAMERLAEIQRQPKPFPRWMAEAGGGMFSAAFVLFAGGSWLGAVIAFASFSSVLMVMRAFGRLRVPDFFSTMFASAYVTGIAMLLWAFSVPIEPSIVVAGGIMLLLPSTRFVSAIQDAINGFPVTAAGRFFSALITYGAIIGGIMAALGVAGILGLPVLDVTQVGTITYPGWLLAVFVGVALLHGSMFEQTARNLVLPTAAVGLLSYAVYVLAQSAGVGERLTPAVAAVVAGVAGRWVALRLGAPQLVVAVPAAYYLLPGLTIFRAMYDITINAGTISVGLIQMFNAMTVILAMSGGIVLGDTIARPLTKGWASHERRRIRRR